MPGHASSWACRRQHLPKCPVLCSAGAAGQSPLPGSRRGSGSRGAPGSHPSRPPPTRPPGGPRSAGQLQQQAPRQAPGRAVVNSRGRAAPAPPRQQQQQPQQPQPGRVGVPVFNKPIVVEGHNDRIAVQRAVTANVYVLGGVTQIKPAMLEQLRALSAAHGGLVVLTDADVAGRQARNKLEAAIPGCYHAFVPEPLATASTSSDWHEAGNVGVEHAAPAAIMQALQRARRGDAQRAEFSREELIEMGLVAPHHLTTGGDFAVRRALVCAYLGIGNCDGKQLLRQLNAYGFLREDLCQAMLWAKGQLAQRQQQAGAQQQ